MHTGGVAASVAVGHGPVPQADLLHLHLRRQGSAHHLPQRQRVGGAALGGVQRQHPPHGGRPLPRRQPLQQLRYGGPEGRLLIGAADLGLHPEVPQGTGGLHQRASQKGAARLIGGEHQITGGVLGV